MPLARFLNPFGGRTLLLLSCFVGLLASGCNRGSAPPAQLAVEQLPGALEKAFRKAAPDLKELVGQIIGNLQTPDYPHSYLGLQSLAAQSGLTKEQARVTTSGLLAVNGHLQTAQHQGDQAAAQTLKYYRQNK